MTSEQTLIEPEMTEDYFTFEQEPNVKVFHEAGYLTNIIGKRTDGSIVEVRDITSSGYVKNPRPIPIEVGNKIVTRIGNFKIKGNYAKNEPIERFKSVVDAISKISGESGEWGQPYGELGDNIWLKKGFPNYVNIVKFLDVADAVGFYDLQTKKRKKRIDKGKDPKRKKQAAEFDEFLKIPAVERWRGRFWNEKTQDFDKGSPRFKDTAEHKAKTLRKALILLDMTTDEFLDGTKNDEIGRKILERLKIESIEELQNPENVALKIDALTMRLNEKTFQAVGIEKQQFPNPVSLWWWAGSPYIPTETDLLDPKGEIEKNTNQVKLIRVTFSKQRDARFDPSKGGVKKELTKYMRHFAESNGITGTWTEEWSQKTPIAKHGTLDMDVQYLKDFEDCLKNKDAPFDDKGEFTIYEEELRRLRNSAKASRKTDMPFPETVFNLKTKTRQPQSPKYLGKVIRYQKGDYIPKILANGFVVDPAVEKIVDGVMTLDDKEYYNIKKMTTNTTDWDYAYMYYKGAMELGWRAEEAFTAGCNKIKEDDQSSGVYEMVSMGEILFMLQIMTRKTAETAGGLFQGGSIQNPETQKMIKEKRDYVEKYMDVTKYTYDQAKAKGVIQSYTSYEIDEAKIAPNPDYNPKQKGSKKWLGLPEDYGKEVPVKIHALVGADNYFTEIATMEFPTTANFEKIKRDRWKENNWTIPQVVKRDGNRDKMKAIMRHCFEKVLPDAMYKDYFKFHSLHALRHLFAQFWLKATQNAKGVRDFASVMKMGHWGGIDVLMNFYGQTSNLEIAHMKNEVGELYATHIEKLVEAEKKRKEKEEKEKAAAKALDRVDPPTMASQDGDQLESGSTNTSDEVIV